MEIITVIIERNNDGSYTAVPQHNHKIGFIEMRKESSVNQDCATHPRRDYAVF
ncbi:MAG: hypothetical protein J5741_07480 [Bacteroidales bacterium]|nr:hypothetical protein [Bacteroidales bacterium]